METQQVVAQFLQLPADAQRIVADLIAYLDRREAPHHLDAASPAVADEQAIVLPPLWANDTPEESTHKPMNDANYQGEKADWDRPDFDFREWRRQIWERPKAQL